MENLFIKGTKNKYRFESNAGSLTIEALWDLELVDSRKRVPDHQKVDLNRVAQNLHKKLKEEGEVDFVNEKSSTSSELENKLEIVKYIIQAKKDAKDAANKRKDTIKNNNLIDQLIAEKKMDAMKNMSIDELEKLKG